MGYPTVRQVLLLAVKEEARDHNLLCDAWYSWTRARAEGAMINLIAQNGGTVTTPELSSLYQELPWLVRAVGPLRDFCEKSGKLLFIARGRDTRAKVVVKTLQLPDKAEDGW